MLSVTLLPMVLQERQLMVTMKPMLMVLVTSIVKLTGLLVLLAIEILMELLTLMLGQLLMKMSLRIIPEWIPTQMMTELVPI